MEKRIASAAIFVCAVMALVAAAPLVAGDIHDITKGAKGPNASAVAWNYVAPDYGQWNANITNNGLRWMVIEVADNSTGVPVGIAREHIRFAAVGAYPTGTALSSPVQMAKGRPYVITAIPNGPKGSSAIVADEFAVKVPPIADFTATPTYLDVAFDASASYDPDGMIVSWDWTFGDGMTGSGEMVTHTYAMAQDWTVTLKVTDDDGLTASATQIVTTTNPPVQVSAKFTVTPDYMTANVDASASTGEGALTYAWNWGDATTGSGMIASHTYVAEGTYLITLTVTDSLMATATATQSFTAALPPVPEPPVAVINAAISFLDVTVDGSGSYDPDGGTIVAWAWDFGDGATATGVTASHSYATAGVKTITLTVTDSDDALTGTATKDVTAIEPPKPPVAVISASIVYLDVAVDGSGSYDPDGTIVAWAWDFGDGATATGATATHSYATAGVKTITLTVTDSQALTNSATKDVTATEPPKPPVPAFTWVADYLSVSFDGSGSSDPDGTVVAWAWDFGDGATATGSMATHVYAAAGTYPVTLTVTDSQTLSASLTRSVTVVANTPPVASFTWMVTGADVSFTSTSTDDKGIVSWAWEFGDGSTGSGETVSHAYVKPVLSTHIVLGAPGTLAEPPPFSLIGYTYGPDGVTPMVNCVVLIKNLRTGDTLSGVSDPDYGIILVDGNYPNLNKFTSGIAENDVIEVTATNGAYSGVNTGVVHLAAGSIMIDVVLHSAGPVLVDFSVKLTVTDAYGLSSSVTNVVTVEF